MLTIDINYFPLIIRIIQNKLTHILHKAKLIIFLVSIFMEILVLNLAPLKKRKYII